MSSFIFHFYNFKTKFTKATYFYLFSYYVPHFKNNFSKIFFNDFCFLCWFILQFNEYLVDIFLFKSTDVSSTYTTAFTIQTFHVHELFNLRICKNSRKENERNDHEINTAHNRVSPALENWKSTV